MTIRIMLSHKIAVALGVTLFASLSLNAQRIDYSVVSVPEESGTEFVKITRPGDYVAMPIVKRGGNSIQWLTNRIIDVSPDGNTIAYLSIRSGNSNIFLKDLSKQGTSVQRTQRSAVQDFSFSPDGKKILFSERRGKENQIFLTDAANGYVCRQITSGNNDYSPIFSKDLNQIFFSRSEQRGSSIWSHDLKNNFLSSFFAGMNPYPIPDETALLVVRFNENGNGEIWKVNYSTGIEECLVSDPNHGFTTPSISPDGRWIVMVGDGHLPTPNGGTYYNTDIYVVRTDGTQLTQLTSHAADDLSPVWSADGKYIYFISQRGDADANANIWRIPFLL